MQGNVFYFGWEIALMAWLQAHMGAVGEKLAVFFTLFGEELMLVVIIGFVYWCWHKEKAKQLMAAVGAGLLWNPMMKNIVLRRRPYFDSDVIRCLKPVDASSDIFDISAQGYSFPSGHSTQSMSVFVMLARLFRNRWTRLAAIVLPLMVGISRFCLGVHFPTDVLCGWAMGLACALIVPWLWNRLDRRVVYLILLVSGIPGLFYCKTTDFFTGFGLMAGGFAAFLFEERYVRFENTRSPLQVLLRMTAGGSLYVVANAVLKLPFSAEWLASGSTGALLVRACRYAMIGFVEFGIYPMTFKWMARLSRKKEAASL